MGTPSSGCCEMAKVYIRNRGFSKCYHQYDLQLRLKDGAGNTYPLNTKYPDSTRWEGEKAFEESFRVSYLHIPAGEYFVELALLYGEAPVKLALKQELLQPDGYYQLSKITVSAL